MCSHISSSSASAFSSRAAATGARPAALVPLLPSPCAPPLLNGLGLVFGPFLVEGEGPIWGVRPVNPCCLPPAAKTPWPPVGPSLFLTKVVERLVCTFLRHLYTPACVLWVLVLSLHVLVSSRIAGPYVLRARFPPLGDEVFLSHETEGNGAP